MALITAKKISDKEKIKLEINKEIYAEIQRYWGSMHSPRQCSQRIKSDHLWVWIIHQDDFIVDF